jgi:hypothetical protein
MAEVGRRSSRMLTRKRNIDPFVLWQDSGGTRNGARPGIYVPGTLVDTELEGSIQPLTDKQRENLPEGERLAAGHSIFFRTTDGNAIRPLKVGSAPADSDYVIIKSGKYWVRAVSDWALNNHIVALVTRDDNQDG